MERKSRRALRLDSLEGRVYLSVSGHSLGSASAAHVRSHSVSLTGTLKLPMPSGDANVVATQGTGNVHPLGRVNVAGTLTSTGDAGGGNLTLNGQSGSVSLVFSVQPPHGLDGLPSFHFTITGGSGAYEGASGHGTLLWKLEHQPVISFQLHGTMRP
jgi:hypothetical protein